MKTRALLAIVNFSRACEFVPVTQEQASRVCDRAFQFNSDRRQHTQETARITTQLLDATRNWEADDN